MTASASAAEPPPPPPITLGALFDVQVDTMLTVFTGKVEVGQNIRTSLAQCVAEELRLPVDRVSLVMADTERTPYDAGTFGSRTTPTVGAQLRAAAAVLREHLLDLAAERWEARREDLVLAGGIVTHPEGAQSVTLGDLAQRGDWRELPVPELDDAPVTLPERWKVAGTSVPRTEAEGLVTGAHRYASDVSLPGMLFGKVLRPPAFGATLRALPAGGEPCLPANVTLVHQDGFAGVAAPTMRQAAQALAQLKPEWDLPPAEASSETLYRYFKQAPIDPQLAERFGGGVQFSSGSVQDGLASAGMSLERTFTAAYIAHAPLEPRAAVAQWGQDERGRPTLTVWTGTQRPFGVRGQLVEAFGLPESQVRVVVPDTGSGYGGKHQGDAALEAARLARAAGRPVKVIWTREEEFTWAYFRPAALIEIAAGAVEGGLLHAWEVHNYNAGPSALRPPYEIPHQHVEYHVVRSPLRQGAYRALAATANTFATESMMDELAAACGQDPLVFRLRNLYDPRLRAVLEAAAERFRWSAPLAPAAEERRGAGVACGALKGSNVATCAEVVVDGQGELHIVRVVVAFECGAVINPDNLRNQIEGAVIQGLGGALWEQIEFADGRVRNPRFSEYRVPRFTDLPPIETVVLDRKDLPPAGAGETPIIGIAPAIANAVCAATGIRLRSLPLFPGGRVRPALQEPPARSGD